VVINKVGQGPGRSKSGSAGPGQVEIRECRARSGRVKSKSGSVGPSLSVTDLSLPHPPRRARSAWTPSPITDRRGALCTGFTLLVCKTCMILLLCFLCVILRGTHLVLWDKPKISVLKNGMSLKSERKFPFDNVPYMYTTKQHMGFTN